MSDKTSSESVAFHLEDAFCEADLLEIKKHPIAQQHTQTMDDGRTLWGGPLGVLRLILGRPIDEDIAPELARIREARR